MVTNTWVKVVNEDQDDDDDPAEYRYYYMQNSGKAYKAGDSGKTKFKTIDGKKYAFDEDGKMLYGWGRMILLWPAMTPIGRLQPTTWVPGKMVP